MRGRRLRSVVLLAALVLTACAGPGPLSGMFRPGIYTVRSGDTLYSIAWRYELEVEQLVRWNNLDSPDLLFPGQELRLSPPPGGSRKTAGGDSEMSGVVLGEQDGDAGGAADAPPEPSEPTGNAAQTAPDVPGDWRWPVEGEVIGTFGDGASHGRGIDIAGETGSTVRAASGGRVVYSGDGLQAYGRLIIIRHSRAYLSAYAHNRRLLVAEGDSVDGGQAIAEMGRALDDRPMLHFEIRHNGAPVNPLEYLPSR